MTNINTILEEKFAAQRAAYAAMSDEEKAVYNRRRAAEEIILRAAVDAPLFVDLDSHSIDGAAMIAWGAWRCGVVFSAEEEASIGAALSEKLDGEMGFVERLAKQWNNEVVSFQDSGEVVDMLQARRASKVVQACRRTKEERLSGVRKTIFIGEDGRERVADVEARAA